MATFQGTSKTELDRPTVDAEGGLLDAMLDVTVIALIAAGFVTLAFNTVARL